MKRLRPSLLLLFTLLTLALGFSAAAAEPARHILVRAILAEGNASRITIINSLAGSGDEAIAPILTAWKQDALFIYTAPGGAKIPIQLADDKDAAGTQAAIRIENGRPLLDATGHPVRLAASDLTSVDHTSSLRRAMKSVIDLLDLSTDDEAKRIQAIGAIGHSQNAEKLAALQARAQVETAPAAQLALREAIALIGLKSGDTGEKLDALKVLRELHTMGSADALRAALKDAEAASQPTVAAAARAAIKAVESHISTVNFFGTLFRGLSLGSILLIVALGLAITFGLMGVINMAHGEMMAVGAYTTYIVQNLFGDGMDFMIPFTGLGVHLPGAHFTGWVYQCYFVVAIPLSFLTAAAVGVGLERSVIRHLYRRPLDSLLATWGVSLVLQQLFKLTFGANNVQVVSPAYLSGNWTYADIIFGWNRVFVIGFAGVTVLGIWLVLTKTSLGLLMRAVMQNRGMASCMGIRTARVNMLTFGLGSGLAGLAGAFLSQIGNVGPFMGQGYIVDCFMTVVVGGVGSITGTVTSSLGIGLADQSLQQILLNPVIGKVLVLVCIILFLQWRPAGIFVTRSRSLD